MTIAFATYRDHPDIHPDDAYVVQALQSLGLPVEARRWDDPEVRWERFRLVIPRTTWDYQERPGEYLAWLDRLESADIRFLNPYPLIRWNLNKRYLRELEEKGAPIVPTSWHPEKDSTGILSALNNSDPESGWVIKPAVSAGAYLTLRLKAGEARKFTAEIAQLAQHGISLRQPYLSEIETQGEWSLMYFGGKLSHSIVKRPQAGDFRVQEMFGGRGEAATPSPAMIRAAELTMKLCPTPPAYARVDLIELGTGPALMELELIEPSLFFRLGPPEASETFAKLVAEAAKSG